MPELTGHRSDKPGDLGNRKGLAIHDEAFCGDLGESSHGARSVHTADQRPIAADRNGLAEDRDPGRRRRRASRSRSQSCAPDGCAPGAKVDCHSLGSWFPGKPSPGGWGWFMPGMLHQRITGWFPMCFRSKRTLKSADRIGQIHEERVDPGVLATD